MREWEVLQDALKPGAASKTVKNAGKWEGRLSYRSDGFFIDDDVVRLDTLNNSRS